MGESVQAGCSSSCVLQDKSLNQKKKKVHLHISLFRLKNESNSHEGLKD